MGTWAGPEQESFEAVVAGLSNFFTPAAPPNGRPSTRSRIAVIGCLPVAVAFTV